MSKQVPWNKIIVEEFIREAMLTKTEEMILRTRVAGWSIKKQAMEFNLSESTVNRVVATLKKKYDNVQKYSPILPPRRSSKEETWLDEN